MIDGEKAPWGGETDQDQVKVSKKICSFKKGWQKQAFSKMLFKE